MAKVTGKISQFGSKGYGFIDSEDGQRYFVHQKNISTQVRLKIGTPVIFDAEDSAKGLVAMGVKLKKTASFGAEPMSDGTIKILFTILFIMQIIIIYQLFFPK